jgi:membrane protease YdiL (CAAX protease family)
VKRFLQSGIGAAVLWVIGSLLLAAVLAPWLYQGGMRLAAAAQTRELAAVLEWLGAACGRSKFGRFFDRALLFSALMLLPFLLRRIKVLRGSPEIAPEPPRALVSWPCAAAQVAAGCVIAGGLLWGMGAILDAAGAYAPRADPPSTGRLLSKILVPAVAAPLLEEWLFRGVLLGLWLRFARPAAACAGTSLLFAFLHFLKPPEGTAIADPAHPLAGFELLGKIMLHFTDPVFFVTDFASLFVVGLILAMARVRSGALWFSIGLHAGWVAAFKGYHLLYRSVENHPLRPWGVGDNLRSGLLPLLTLGLTAVICHFALRRFAAVSRASR